MSTLLADLRQAFRGMRKAPALTVVVVLTLALGIGANSAIFSVINGVLLEPLEYPEPEKLVHITSQFPTMGFDRFWIDPPEFMEYREWNQSYTDVAGYRATEVSIAGSDRPLRVRSAVVTASIFPVLGVQPIRGRVFTEEEDVPGGPPVVVISHELWTSAFAADDSVVGSDIDIDGSPTTILGVMPPGFDIEENDVQVWVPLGFGPDDMQRRGNHFLFLVARLEDGATLQSARAELNVLVESWQDRSGGGHTPSTDGHPFQILPLHEEIVGNSRPALMALLGAVGFVLLIACANVANLLLTRSEARQKEMAVRTAMGASRVRLLRQLLTESVALALMGGAIRLALANLGLGFLLRTHPESLPRTDEVTLDSTVLVVSLAVAVLTGLLFGLVPGLQLSSGKLSGLLKEGAQRTSSAGAGVQVRRFLVVVEMALAVALVVGSGLMLKSVATLLAVDTGFDAARLTSFEIFLPPEGYADGGSQRAFHQRLGQGLNAIPGVESIGIASGLPPLRDLNANDTQFEGIERDPKGPPHNIDYYQFISDDYLETMDIPLIAGRGFRLSDDAQSAPVTLINQKTADTFWPGQNPLGRRLRPGGGDGVPWITIVGIVGDVKQGGIDRETGTEIYFRYGQVAQMFGPFLPRSMYTLVRSTLPTEPLAQSIREQVRAIDPALPIGGLQSMQAVIEDSISRPRFLAMLLSIFAGLALFLASIGIYGVLSYSVAERGQEMGIRMALGADRDNILQLVLRQGMTLAVVGLAVGVVGSLALSRVLQSLLFGVSATDPMTYLWVVGLLALVAFVACALPAFRATRVDLLTALRYE